MRCKRFLQPVAVGGRTVTEPHGPPPSGPILCHAGSAHRRAVRPVDKQGDAVIIVGEALVDLVPEPDGRLDPRPGGSARNVAIAAARLGARVDYVGGLSEDGFGRRMRDEFAAEGVDTGCAPVVTAPTPLAVVDVDDDGHADYHFHLVDTAALALTADDLACLRGDEPLHVSLGAITLATPRVGDALVALLASHDARTSLDPNVRSAFLTDPVGDAERLDAAVSLVDLVRCSDEDLALLHGDDVDVETVVAGWRDGGAVAVVVTEGDGGARAWCPHGSVRVAADAVEVVDTVGAGDTFGAALLVALDEAGATDRAGLELLDLDAWEAVLGFAARAAAVTVGRRGADPPHRDEV